jgi:recombinational DNA repair protein (RecF pathway)
MAELINKSVEENSENNDVFFLLRDSLDTLDADGKKKKFVVNKFEFLLMKLLGYEMSLNELRSFKKEELDNRLKLYVKESLGEDFKSLTI